MNSGPIYISTAFCGWARKVWSDYWRRLKNGVSLEEFWYLDIYFNHKLRRKVKRPKLLENKHLLIYKCQVALFPYLLFYDVLTVTDRFCLSALPHWDLVIGSLCACAGTIFHTVSSFSQYKKVVQIFISVPHGACSPIRANTQKWMMKKWWGSLWSLRQMQSVRATWCNQKFSFSLNTII